MMMTFGLLGLCACVCVFEREVGLRRSLQEDKTNTLRGEIFASQGFTLFILLSMKRGFASQASEVTTMPCQTE